MRKILFLLFVTLSFMVTHAQVQKPVKWSFSSNLISTGVYEVHLKATISAGWHIYSQTTPDGGPVATAISFNKNPLVTLDGKTKEVGKLEKHHEELFGVDVKQFSNNVDFVQKVKVKGNAKTVVAGKVSFMVCNDKLCLPPTEEKFSISLK